MNLFIDDIRNPEDAGLHADGWTIARDYDSAVKAIEEYKPQRIAFDHDLSSHHYAGEYGGEKTGYDVAKWIVEKDMDDPSAGYITVNFQFSSHSANPDGKRNIVNLLRSYKHKKFGYQQ